MPNAKPFLLAVLIVVAGCATQPAKDPGTAHVSAAGTDTQCHSERLTGTMIPNTVCTSKTMRDTQQATVQEVRSEVEIAPQVGHPSTP